VKPQPATTSIPSLMSLKTTPIVSAPGTSISTGLAPSQLPLKDPMENLVQRSLAQQLLQMNNMSNVQLPTFYNPGAINPVKYAEQIQKRKLLWGNKEKKDPSATPWSGTNFTQDQDGQVSAKFRRLMGIKDDGTKTETCSEKTSDTDLMKKQEEMFRNMEKQYEVARMVTHTQRGLGLGFGSSVQQQPAQVPITQPPKSAQP